MGAGDLSIITEPARHRMWACRQLQLYQRGLAPSQAKHAVFHSRLGRDAVVLRRAAAAKVACSARGKQACACHGMAWPQVGVTKFGDFEVEVVDPVADYLAVLSRVFDFPMIKAFLSRPDVSIVFDAMHAVTGPYAYRILCDVSGHHTTQNNTHLTTQHQSLLRCTHMCSSAEHGMS